MSEPQKKAAALVAMIFLAIPAATLIWLAMLALGGGELGDRFPGSFVLAVASDGDAAQTAFKLAPVIVSVGLSFLVPKTKSDWRFLVTVTLAVLAIIASGYLYFALQGAGLAHRFWSYTDIESMASPEAIAGRLRPALLLFIGWFFGVLAAQLSIKLTGGGDEP